jgi:hypothetical protein
MTVAQHCAIALQSVHAYIVGEHGEHGEHGDSEAPLRSSAALGGVPLITRSRLLRQHRADLCGVTPLHWAQVNPDTNSMGRSGRAQVKVLSVRGSSG